MPGTMMRPKADLPISCSQSAPLLTLPGPSTLAAYTAGGFWGKETTYETHHLAVAISNEADGPRRICPSLIIIGVPIPDPRTH
jgi:hypothetical protein